jgi:hypothetical protein
VLEANWAETATDRQEAFSRGSAARRKARYKEWEQAYYANPENEDKKRKREEKRVISRKRYAAENKEAISAKANEYQKKNEQELKTKAAAYSAKPETKEKKKAYYEAHKEEKVKKHAERHAERHAANKAERERDPAKREAYRAKSSDTA